MVKIVSIVECFELVVSRAACSRVVQFQPLPGATGRPHPSRVKTSVAPAGGNQEVISTGYEEGGI